MNVKNTKCMSDKWHNEVLFQVFGYCGGIFWTFHHVAVAVTLISLPSSVTLITLRLVNNQWVLLCLLSCSVNSWLQLLLLVPYQKCFPCYNPFRLITEPYQSLAMNSDDVEYRSNFLKNKTKQKRPLLMEVRMFCLQKMSAFTSPRIQGCT